MQVLCFDHVSEENGKSHGILTNAQSQLVIISPFMNTHLDFNGDKQIV